MLVNERVITTESSLAWKSSIEKSVSAASSVSGLQVIPTVLASGTFAFR